MKLRTRWPWITALLAAAVVPVGRAIVDVGRFDLSSDDAFLDRLYLPGIRRAGDFRTAAGMTKGHVVIHNAGDRFSIDGQTVRGEKLTPEQLLQLLKQRSGS